LQRRRKPWRGKPFDEIGRREGITKGGAFMSYKSGIRKLRRRGLKIAQLRALADELDRGRPAGETKL
jgi:hypothetical protein